MDLGSFEVQESVLGSCVGDCDGDGRVTIDELLTMVGVVLGSTAESTCSAGSEDTLITIGDLVAAVNNALRGCEIH